MIQPRKKMTWTLSAAILFFCSCQPTPEKSAYIHKYGMSVSKKEWQTRGQSGQEVTMERDGVEIMRTYRQGVLHGKTTYSFPLSKLVEKQEIYADGNLKEVTWNYVSGHPKEQHQYQDDFRAVTHWYENGSPMYKEYYEKDRLLEAQYFNNNQEKEAEVSDGYGRRVMRDESGQMIAADLIKDGQTIYRTEFYKTGTPKAVMHFANGVTHGTKETFTRNGEPLSVEKWSHGKQDGLTQTFRNGVLRSEVQFADGLKEGLEVIYREDGSPAQETQWSRGLKHGKETSFIHGLPQEGWFYKNHPITQSEFTQRTSSRKNRY